MKDLIKVKFLIFIITFLVVGIVKNVFAQDIQFSQYYNLVQYQNPAFVGTAYSLRGILQSRIQWPGIDSRYLTTVAAVDYNADKFNSGFGGMLMQDDQGAGAIRTFKGVFQYSYLLSISQNLFLRSGLSLGFARSVLNNAALYYPDQFNGNGFSSNSENSTLTSNYVDVGSGFLLYANQCWFGISAAHLNKPSNSFINQMEKLPIKIDIIGGYKFILKKKETMRYLEDKDEEVWALYPTFLYKMQGKSDQLDVGIYSIYKIFTTGLWYRGIPFKNYENNFVNHESISALAGIKINNVALNYSYDFVISKLYPSSRGAHEINLTWYYPQLKSKKPKVKYKRLPCPSFYK